MRPPDCFDWIAAAGVLLLIVGLAWMWIPAAVIAAALMLLVVAILGAAAHDPERPARRRRRRPADANLGVRVDEWGRETIAASMVHDKGTLVDDDEDAW
jgi:membrane protein implicated in regulation of membrane protease activity